MKVCIIGAGTAGLCSGRHALQNNIEPTIFEQTGQIGGTWVYTDKTKTDEFGNDIHSSMYQGLRTNLPKEIMGYPDYKIMEQCQSYIPAKDICNFLEEYAKCFQITEYIKFFHYVIRIQPCGNGWQVIVKNLKDNNTTLHLFDYVMICSGHYHTPLYPTIQGMDLFSGEQIHSHEFRSAKHFKDKAVLVIGAGPSGMDLCHEISKLALRVTLSHHLPEKPKTKFYKNVSQKPDVKRLSESGAFFEDGSHETFTAIFYCTGYKYSFPFLSVDSGIYIQDNFVQPLYKHCININYPKMAFIGLPYYVCAAQMMDLQARFCMKYYTFQKPFPSKFDMILNTKEEMDSRWIKGYIKRQAHMMGPQQIQYYTDLAETADVENIKPVMTKLHNESSELFLNDLINFRKDIFRIVDEETFIKLN